MMLLLVTYFLRHLQKQIFGMPPPPPSPENFKFYHRFMFIAPSGDHSLLILKLPFKVILKTFEVVFWCLEWEWCTVKKIGETSFKSTNTLLALTWLQFLNEGVLFNFTWCHHNQWHYMYAWHFNIIGLP